jgi:hypothetical protein
MKSRNGIEPMKILLVALVLSLGTAAEAKVVEEQFDLPVLVTDAYGKRIDRSIKVTVFDDDSIDGPKPVIVINHGRAGDPADRATMGRSRYPKASAWFAREGFIVALPTRIGYGVTGGEDVEDAGACSHKNTTCASSAST